MLQKAWTALALYVNIDESFHEYIVEFFFLLFMATPTLYQKQSESPHKKQACMSRLENMQRLTARYVNKS